MRTILAAVVAVGLAVTLAAAQDDRPPFADWLSGVRQEALARGIRQEVVDEALGDLTEPLPIVIERDRSQAETVLPLEAYISRRVTPKVIRTARAMFERHRAVLNEVGKAYGVAPQIVVGVWGVESNFGSFSGVRPTIASLATLAYDPRRSAFFREQLFDALEIVNRGDIEATEMRGSWAGAMGQPQFMPSSYLDYAEDFDGDGRRDIWNSPPDIFASIANYLKGHGWTAGQTWGREVRVPPAAAAAIHSGVARRAGTCEATRDMSVAMPLREWRRLGLTQPGGAKLPASDQLAALVDGKSRHFLVYSNYDALLEYNCAHAYALTVALLANRLS